MTAPAVTVRTGMLDCIQANLALLADRWGEPLRHLALGAHLRFRPRPGPDGLPTVDPPPQTHIRQARALIGLVPRHVHHDLEPEALRALSRRTPVVYAVGDTHDMPWLPYAGRARMEHSFLVSGEAGEACVEDAYDNETAWGPARPGRWRLPWEQLPTARTAVEFTAPAAYRAPRPAVALDDPGPYVQAYAAHPDRLTALRRLTSETWLMARARHLHAAYREHRGESPDTHEHLRRWDRLTATAFIALRRAERGRPVPDSLLPDLAAALHADREVFAVRDEQTEPPDPT
ncbi:hypothetical protein [Streptomyces sp. SID5643]|uniref:hypothetical protein n=1 Tax=Streptomyces sp. SID5643 TaxID=2690307 RepID=UPI0013681286|nr:hypothetical protein [Streptomyces sp. SID5643]MZF84750.1 hypothetical protein [Streptomyces sp. SID5643]